MDRLDEIIMEIETLHAKAEPLRILPADDVMAGYALSKIVDQINALRAEESFLRDGYLDPNQGRRNAQMQPKHQAELQAALDRGEDPRVPPGVSMNQAKQTLHLPKR